MTAETKLVVKCMCGRCLYKFLYRQSTAVNGTEITSMLFIDQDISQDNSRGKM